MKSRILPFALAAVAAVTAACGKDPFAVDATNDTVADTFVVYALTGTAATLPSAINTPFHAAALVDSSFNFDVALDIDDAGRIVVLPVRRVGTPFSVSRNVGLAAPDTPYDSLKRAPNGGYVVDSTRVVDVGQAVVVQAVTPVCTLSGTSNLIYSKFVVDSVNPATRAMYVRMVVDPNCGFMSFQPGLPGS